MFYKYYLVNINLFFDKVVREGIEDDRNYINFQEEIMEYIIFKIKDLINKSESKELLLLNF